MSATYRVDLVVGPYSWTINKGDAPSLPTVADGLTVAWEFPDGPLWPVQPEPTLAKFSLIAADEADLNAVDTGTPVRLRVWAGVTISGTQYDSVTFTGTVGDLQGGPIAFIDPVTEEDVDGWQLDVIAVDPTADLADYTPSGTSSLHTSGATALSARDWVTELFVMVGLPTLEDTSGGTSGTSGGSGSLTPDNGYVDGSANLAAAAEATLSAAAEAGELVGSDPTNPYSWQLYPSHGWRRGILRPNTSAAGIIDAAHPYRFEWISRKYENIAGLGSPAPAVIGPVGGGKYGPVLSHPTLSPEMALVIDADYLAYDAKWARTKFTDPNKVTVTNNVGAARFAAEGLTNWNVVNESNRLSVQAVRGVSITDTRLMYSAYARHVATMYLDDTATADKVWAASGFVWFASQDPAWPARRSLFPGTALFGGYSAPVVINGIPDSQAPGEAPWYAGVPKGAEWRFERGEFSIAFDLYPRVPSPAALPNVGITATEFRAKFPAVTTTDMSTAYTTLDYRLVRTTAYDL